MGLLPDSGAQCIAFVLHFSRNFFTALRKENFILTRNLNISHHCKILLLAECCQQCRRSEPVTHVLKHIPGLLQNFIACCPISTCLNTEACTMWTDPSFSVFHILLNNPKPFYTPDKYFTCIFVYKTPSLSGPFTEVVPILLNPHQVLLSLLCLSTSEYGQSIPSNSTHIILGFHCLTLHKFHLWKALWVNASCVQICRLDYLWLPPQSISHFIGWALNPLFLTFSTPTSLVFSYIFHLLSIKYFPGQENNCDD